MADPAALAAFVLRDRPDWDERRIRGTLEQGGHERVVLPRKIPVYLLYLTAFEHRGVVAFRDDLYGVDDRLMRALEAPAVEAGARVGAR